MKITGRRLVFILLAAAVLAGAVLALLPSPLPVETAPAAAGPLTVSIDEEGRTSARDRYTVAAPTAGRLDRVTLRAGDPVTRGQALAVLHLAPLDPREREAAEGRLRAAEALRREAVENLERARADAAQAARERERAEQLHRKGYSALQELEQARNAETAALKGAEAARFRVEAAASEVAVAQAALLAGEGAPPTTAAASRCARRSTAGCCGCSSRASASSPPGRRSSRSATPRGSRSSSRCSRPTRSACARGCR